MCRCLDVGAPPFDDDDIKAVGDMYNLAVSVLQPDFQADYATHVSTSRAAAGLPPLQAPSTVLAKRKAKAAVSHGPSTPRKRKVGGDESES